MKATIEKTNTGGACGKQHLRVESNSGKLLGFIQPTNVDFPGCSCTTVYVVQSCHNGNYRCYLGNTLAEAFSKLGISLKELDNSELPDGIYDEFCFKRFY